MPTYYANHYAYDQPLCLPSVDAVARAKAGAMGRRQRARAALATMTLGLLYRLDVPI